MTRPAIFMLVFGLTVAAALEPFIGLRVAIILAGISLISADLLYKYRSIKIWRSTDYFDPTLGGSVFLIPVWFVGIIAIGFAIFG